VSFNGSAFDVDPLIISGRNQILVENFEIFA